LRNWAGNIAKMFSLEIEY
jgi:hypothetical protein